jgi:HlyD family secretion protein
MKMKYWLIFLLLAAGVASYFLFFKKSDGIQIITTKVEKGDITIGVTATGTLSALTTIDVGTQVSGVISKIYVDFNSEVKKGQIIALLDTTSLAVSVQESETNLSSAIARYNQIKQEYDRNKMLLEKKVIPQVEFDQSYTSLQTAGNDVRSARAQVSRMRINLKFAKIVSPIDGIVISRNVNVGQTVASSFNTPTLFSIANDLSKMQVTANVDEADIGQVKEGQKVKFTVDAFNESIYEGKVKQIRIQPNVLQNVVTYTVVIDAENPGKKLLPGMTASITIVQNERTDVKRIPLNALGFAPDKQYWKSFCEFLPDSTKEKFKDKKEDSKKGDGEKKGRRARGEIKDGSIQSIWVKSGEKVFPMKVITGLSDGTMIEVKGDLKEGDQVVVGVMAQAKEQSQQKSPFMPQMGRPKRK